MNIGILTYHYVFNEGATWQAYTLCSELRRQLTSHKVEIIDFRHKNKFKHLRSVRPPEYRAPHCNLLKPLLSKKSVVSNDWAELSAIVESEYDLCIVGSDIVWQFDYQPISIKKIRKVLLYNPFNPNTSSLHSFLRDVKNWTLRVFRQVRQNDPLKIDVPNVYWLPEGFQCKRVSFAVSIGYSDPKSVPRMDRGMMVENLSRFSLLGVRDVETRDFLAKLDSRLGARARLVPDPAWLFDEPLPDGKMLLDEFGVDLNRPKAGVLYPRGNLYTKCFDREITQELQEKGFQVVSIIDRNPLANFDCASRPLPIFAWWSLIKEMDFLFTVRTHPTIAALMYHTPFLNVDITARIKGAITSKSHSMLADFSLDQFCLFQPGDLRGPVIQRSLSRALEHDWDWDRVDQEISNYRQRERQFINELRELVDAN